MPDTIMPTSELISTLAINQNRQGNNTGNPYSKNEERENHIPDEQKTKRSVQDIASILNIPSENVSEDTQKAIVKLLDEMDYLRWKVKNLEGRLKYFEGKADIHHSMPFFNQRAFIREIEKRIAHFANVNLGGCLVMFELHNFFEIRKNDGISEAEAALLLLASTIKASVRASDIIGAIDYARIAVIMPFVGIKEGKILQERIKETMRTRPFKSKGKSTFLEIYTSCVDVPPDGDALHILEIADKSLKD